MLHFVSNTLDYAMLVWATAAYCVDVLRESSVLIVVSTNHLE